MPFRPVPSARSPRAATTSIDVLRISSIPPVHGVSAEDASPGTPARQGAMRPMAPRRRRSTCGHSSLRGRVRYRPGKCLLQSTIPRSDFARVPMLLRLLLPSSVRPCRLYGYRRLTAPRRVRAARTSGSCRSRLFGSGPNTTVRGTLYRARWSRQKAMTSSPVTAPVPSRKVTNAQGVSPHVSSGRATTAASSTAGWR